MISYIIDGHNFIHEIPVYLELLDRNYVECQKKLFQQLQTYTETRKVFISLVFDGNQPWEPSTYSTRLKIHFSGSNREADDVIIALAKKWGNRNVFVVTRDRALHQAVVAVGCRVMLPVDFYNLINTKNRKTSSWRRFRDRYSLTPEEVKEWKALMKVELAKRQKDEN
ncbi:MAG: NYN domain-containing protein [Fidelibacterota bacterium]